MSKVCFIPSQAFDKSIQPRKSSQDIVKIPIRKSTPHTPNVCSIRSFFYLQTHKCMCVCYGHNYNLFRGSLYRSFLYMRIRV